MDHQLFFNLVKRWAEHIYGDSNVNIETLLKESKSNRRARNICVFYALTSEECFKTFESLSKSDKQILEFKNELIKALRRLEKEQDVEVSSLAKDLKAKYYPHEELEFEEDKYDVSAEMAKLYISIINSYRLANVPADKDFQDRVSEFDLSILK